MISSIFKNKIIGILLLSISLFFATPSFAQLTLRNSSQESITLNRCKEKGEPYILTRDNDRCGMVVSGCRNARGDYHFNTELIGTEGQEKVDAYTSCVFENIPDNGLAGVDLGSYATNYSLDDARGIHVEALQRQEKLLLARFESQCNKKLGRLLDTYHNRVQFHNCLKQNQAFNNLTGPDETRGVLAGIIRRCLTNASASSRPQHKYIPLDFHRGVIECDVQAGNIPGTVLCPIDPSDCANNRNSDGVDTKPVHILASHCKRAGDTYVGEDNGVLRCKIPVTGCQTGSVPLSGTFDASCPVGLDTYSGSQPQGVTSYNCPTDIDRCVNSHRYFRTEGRGREAYVRYKNYFVETERVTPRQGPSASSSGGSNTGLGD